MTISCQGEDYRWYRDRAVRSRDFNTMSEVAIFAGPVMDMYPAVTASELKILVERGENFVLVDVRDGDSFEKEHIPGSINIPVARLELDSPKIMGMDELVIVYSVGPLCGANAVGADKLVTIGYKHVMRFRGGIEEWKNSGYRVDGRGMADEPSAEGAVGEAA